MGEIVVAPVARLEGYGLFLTYRGREILVQIPDVSWDRVRHPSDLFDVGETVVAIVTVANERAVVASIRDLHPEDNPWANPLVYGVGTVHSGIAVRVMSYGTFLRLPAGAWGLLAGEALPLGSTTRVRVVEVDPRRKTISLERVPEEETS